MMKLTGRQLWNNTKLVYYNNQIREVENNQYIKDINVVPLFIKKYPNGKFTQQFLSGKYNGEVKISKPRGRGMYLDQLPPGRVLMFAAGTGLNPFADTIDVLFK